MISTPKKIAIVVIVLLWIGALLLAYWWFSIRYFRPFAEDPMQFSDNFLMLPPDISGPGRVRLVHFWDPGCPCNIGNQQHLSGLLQQYRDRVDFYVVQRPESRGALPASLSDLTPLTRMTGTERLTVSPAVAIWDQQGRMAYFGPYSEGAICNASNSFVEPVLEALLQGRAMHITHTLAVGCYCTWQAEKTASQ